MRTISNIDESFNTDNVSNSVSNYFELV